MGFVVMQEDLGILKNKGIKDSGYVADWQAFTGEGGDSGKTLAGLEFDASPLPIVQISPLLPVCRNCDMAVLLQHSILGWSKCYEDFLMWSTPPNGFSVLEVFGSVFGCHNTVDILGCFRLGVDSEILMTRSFICRHMEVSQRQENSEQHWVVGFRV
jgi:hypothetical protein